MPLSDIIIDRIRKEGPISFHDFMEMSLYYPELGYYTSSRDKIGKSGDFYTSPYLTTLFGELVARQIEEMWQVLDRQPFTIVEYGAGTGLLCKDILRQLENNTALYDSLNYYIIERSARMREQQAAILQQRPAILPARVRWVDSIDAIPPVTGCILSNELIDNFAVHRVVMEEQLMEVFVSHDNGFTETLRPAAEPLRNYFRELQVSLPKGFCTEVNLQAVEWIRTVSQNLEKGFVMTIDYGYPSSALYSNGKSAGTLVCYHRHAVSECPYDHIGDQDITTHVNFSALSLWGQHSGLEHCGYTNQALFLQGLGLAHHLRKMEEAMRDQAPDEGQQMPAGRDGTTDARERMMLIHTFLMDMGNKFKVLIQRKGLGARPSYLSGMRFTQRLQ